MHILLLALTAWKLINANVSRAHWSCIFDCAGCRPILQTRQSAQRQKHSFVV